MSNYWLVKFHDYDLVEDYTFIAAEQGLSLAETYRWRAFPPVRSSVYPEFDSHVVADGMLVEDHVANGVKIKTTFAESVAEFDPTWREKCLGLFRFACLRYLLERLLYNKFTQDDHYKEVLMRTGNY